MPTLFPSLPFPKKLKPTEILNHLLLLQMLTYNQSKVQMQKQPSFLNRLIGYEDDQLHSVCSPYTARYASCLKILLSIYEYTQATEK